MNQTDKPTWECKRTDETRQVEAVLKQAGFEQVDAYRYNSASIRLRVIDRCFEGKTPEQRAGLVEPLLEKLPERTQGDIMNLLTFTPTEVEKMDLSFKAYLLNVEFDDPSPSML